VISPAAAPWPRAGRGQIFTIQNRGRLKRLFPNAAAFPPHRRAAALHRVLGGSEATRRRRRSASRSGTTDLGRRSTLSRADHILVGPDMTGTLTGVIVTTTPSRTATSRWSRRKFAMQFKGKDQRSGSAVGRRRRCGLARTRSASQRDARHPRQRAHRREQLLPEAGSSGPGGRRLA